MRWKREEKQREEKRREVVKGKEGKRERERTGGGGQKTEIDREA